MYVDFEEEATASLKDKWERWGAGVQLVVLPSPYRELTRPLLRHIHRLKRENSDDIITVVAARIHPREAGGNTSFTIKARCYSKALCSSRRA